MKFRPIIIWLIVAVALQAQSQEADGMKTKIYRVSPKFRTLVIGHVPLEPSEPFNQSTIQEMLEKIGLEFSADESVEYAEANHTLTVKTSQAQFEIIEAMLESFRGGAEQQIHLYQEWIEVDHMLFSDWLFENKLNSDGTELRNQAQEWIKEGKAAIIESAFVSGRSGNRLKVESIDEYIYPTEYDPAEIPNKVTLKNGAEAPVTAVTPTAFEVRNLGTTFEADPILGADNVTIDVSLAPELVELKEIVSWHKKQTDVRFQTQFPNFYLQKISTQVTGRIGKYVLLGTTRPMKAADPKMTTDPIVLQFLRPDISSIADWSVIEAR